MFSSADLSLGAEKCAAFGIILQNHRRLPVSIFSVKIAALGSLKRVTGRIFKIVSNFKGASLNFEFDFFIQVRNKIVTIISACTENTYFS